MQTESSYCPEVGLMITTWRNSEKKRAFTQDSCATSQACWLSHSITAIGTTLTAKRLSVPTGRHWLSEIRQTHETKMSKTLFSPPFTNWDRTVSRVTLIKLCCNFMAVLHLVYVVMFRELYCFFNLRNSGSSNTSVVALVKPQIGVLCC